MKIQGQKFFRLTSIGLQDTIIVDWSVMVHSINYFLELDRKGSPPIIEFSQRVVVINKTTILYLLIMNQILKVT